jgi:hypothetical protein
MLLVEMSGHQIEEPNTQAAALETETAEEAPVAESDQQAADALTQAQMVYGLLFLGDIDDNGSFAKRIDRENDL